MQDADIVVSKAEYAVGVSADILYAPVPYMVNDEDVVYVVAQESEQFFPVRDGLFGLFLELVKKKATVRITKIRRREPIIAVLTVKEDCFSVSRSL